MLTAAQSRALAFIKTFMAHKGYAPTIAEIARGMGIVSRSAVHRHLQGLVQAQAITLTVHKRRNIELVAIEANISLPVMGNLAAGPFVEVVTHETVDIAGLLLGPDRYVLKVKGNAMLGDCIRDGDLLICERHLVAHSGVMVVALIDQTEMTLKRIFYNEDQTITLVPDNPSIKAMIYNKERVTVRGKLIGLLRMEY